MVLATLLQHKFAWMESIILFLHSITLRGCVRIAAAIEVQSLRSTYTVLELATVFLKLQRWPDMQSSYTDGEGTGDAEIPTRIPT